MSEDVIKANHLMILSHRRKWRKVKVTIRKINNLPYLVITKKQGQVKCTLEITPTVSVEFTEGSREFEVIFSPERNFKFSSHFPTKAANWVAQIRELASKCHYTMDNFEILSVVGKGYYGKVMLCQKKGTDEVYAIKTVHKSRLVKSNKVQTIFTERNALMKAHHPFIVGFYFSFQTDTKFYIGLEFVQGGELFKRVSDEDTIPIHDTRIYVAEAALALEYLHRLRIVYRDLKPENIMIGVDGHIKLTDFGLAKQFESNKSTTTTFCGTSEYMAPEIVSEKAYDERVDWWALGCLTYELLFGYTPFYKKNKVKMFKWIKKKKPEFPEGADPDAVDLILGLLRKKPDQRFTFKDVKHHPFFQGKKFKDILAKKWKPDYLPRAGDGKTENFDSEFTGMKPMDSLATPVVDRRFEGFSCIGGPGSARDVQAECTDSSSCEPTSPRKPTNMD